QKQATDVSKVEIIVHGDDNPHSIESTPDLVDNINSEAGPNITKSGTVLITGSRSSGSWTPQTGTWTSANRPTHVEVRVTLVDDTVYSNFDDTISDHSGNTEATVFASVPEITFVHAEYT